MMLQDNNDRWQTPSELTIEKGEPSEAGQNAWSLKAIALGHIRQLSGKIWTDHNIHDPGVATLETLCFALSDLGYRSSFAIEDLLAEPVSDTLAPAQYFTARSILTNAPVTKLDFRKLMIDTEGVKNAWIRPAPDQESDIFLDREKGELDYIKPVVGGANLGTDDEIKLRGLNAVHLELEYDIEADGDLNDNIIEAELHVTTGAGAEREAVTLELDVGFGGLFDPAEIRPGNPELFTLNPASAAHKRDYIIYQADWSLAHLDWTMRSADSVVVKKNRPGFRWLDRDLIVPLVLEFKTGTVVSTLGVCLHLTDGGRTNLNAQAMRKAIISAIRKSSFAWLNGLLRRYHARVARRLDIVLDTITRLQANRPLSEDFTRVYGMKIEQIAVCADIELAPSADCEKAFSDIRFQIEQFLAPDIQFRTLDHLLGAGVDPADIFEGPTLEHGFLDPVSLRKNVRPDEINTSDLINIIMDIEGVVAVKDILLSSYVDNALREIGARWSLPLTSDKRYVPRLSIDKSKINFFKGFIPCAVDESEADGFYEELVAQRERTRLAAEAYDLAIPQGTYRDLSGYTSVQSHFPLNFGIGQEGLADSESDERKAQAAQFKGYLMFFDQILANHLAQVAGAKDLLSVSNVPDHSYFVSPVYGAPNIAPVIADFVAEHKATTDMTDSDAVDAAWQAYVAADPNNGYQKNLQQITDSREDYERRQNLFLDHLLARFAEQFTDYAMLLYDLEGRRRAAHDLIEDKAQFLKEYPQISSGRGKGFDYFDTQRVWNAENVSGLARRVARLVGVPPRVERNLAPTTGPEVAFFQKADGKWVFKLTLDATATEAQLVITSENFAGTATKKAATEQFYEFLALVTEDVYARPNRGDDGKLRLAILARDGKSMLAESVTEFTDRDGARAVLKRLVAHIDATYFHEGLHVVEHILLRPFAPGGGSEQMPLFPIAYEKGCVPPTPAEITDPYSFRVTVILPALAKRFRNREMRALVERTIHEEAPAHVSLKICWIDYGQLRTFEADYVKWMEMKVGRNPAPTPLAEAQKKLINTLGMLNSIYPTATLHDCENPDESINPVVLGHTAIGSFVELMTDETTPGSNGD